MQQRAGVIGLADAEEREVQLWIVAAGGPYRGAIALLERQSVPAFAAGLAGTRDGVEAPRLLAGLRIQRHDRTATRGLADDALQDPALGDQRPAGGLPALLVVRDR